ncbi:MAG: hypothetical protein WC969_10450 [Elusimicrobiota bacterium]|jgi:hypothetical protein
MKRFFATLLSAVLLALSPGLSPYAAFAQVVVQPVPVSASVPGVVVGAAASRGAVLPQNLVLPGTLSVPAPLPSTPAPQLRLPVRAAAVLGSAELPAAPIARPSAVPASVSPERALDRAVKTLLGTESSVPVSQAAALPTRYASGAARYDARSDGVRRRSLVIRHFAELRRAFASRSLAADDVSGSPVAAGKSEPGKSGLERSGDPASAVADPPPAPAPRVEEDLQARSVSLGRTAGRFLQSSASLWIAVTAMEVAAPMLAEKLSGDFSMTGVVFTAGSIVGQLLSPRLISRYGLRNVYQGALVLGLGAGVTLAGAYALGLLGAPLLMACLFVYSVAHGMWWNANDSVAPHVAGRSRAKLERFWGWDMFVCDVMGTTLSMLAGVMIAAHGFIPALVLVPLGFLLATAFSRSGFRHLGPLDDMKGEREASEGTWAELTRGAKLVFSDPALRAAFLAYAGYMLMTPLLYKMLAPGFGLMLMGNANPEAAAGVAGFISGLYGLGGMFSGLYLMFQGRRLAARRPPMAAGEVHAWEKAQLKVALLKWMRMAAFGLAAVALMALPVPTLGAALVLPSWLSWLGYLSLPALAMIPFGLIQNVVVLKLRSRLQSIVTDPADQPHVMSFVEIASLSLTGLALLAAKFVFGAFPGAAAFGVFAAAMVPLGLLWLKLRAGVAASNTSPPKR